MQCVLCDPMKRWPSEWIVGRLSVSTLLLNRDQYFRGWCLVVADAHVDDLFDLDMAARQAMLEDVARATLAVRKALEPDRMNYAVFGNVTPHLHWNLIPRYRHDGLWGEAPWPHTPESLTPPEAKLLAQRIAERL